MCLLFSRHRILKGAEETKKKLAITFDRKHGDVVGQVSWRKVAWIGKDYHTVEIFGDSVLLLG